MNETESRKLILEATALRAQGQYDDCIKLMLDNLSDIDPDVQLIALIEIFNAARDKPDAALTHQMAREIAKTEPHLPSIQEFL